MTESESNGLTDIVWRMRHNADDPDCTMPPFMRTNCHQAADEIERLRAVIDDIASGNMTEIFHMTGPVAKGTLMGIVKIAKSAQAEGRTARSA